VSKPVDTQVSSQGLAAVPRLAGISLPNFFLVGAPKAGTTSLYHYLDQHPQIYMSPVKEPHYFSEEIRFENFTDGFQKIAAPRLKEFRRYLEGPLTTKFSAGPVEDWTDYIRLFQGVNGEPAIGEASVCYLWSKTAAHNIARHCPDARILILLRDPSEAAFSNYLRTLTIAYSYVPFRDQMETALRSTSTKIGMLYPFLEFGMYYEQVRRYLSLFPSGRVKVYFYEDYVRHPAKLLQAMFRFLGVDPEFLPNLAIRHMQPRVPRSYFAKRVLTLTGLWRLGGALIPHSVRPLVRRVAFQPRETLHIDPADRNRLVEFYRDDIRKLADLLDRDLSAWLLRPGSPD